MPVKRTKIKRTAVAAEASASAQRKEVRRTKANPEKAKKMKAPKRAKKKLGSMDLTFLLLVLILVAFGLVMLFSSSYALAYSSTGDSLYYIKKQGLFAVLGIIVMIVVSRIPYYIYKNASNLIYGVCVALMALVVVLNAGGPGRWIQIGSFSFQPSELMKLAIIIIFAKLIAENYNKMGTFRYGVWPFILALLPVIAILMVFQHHLSATIIICAIGLLMMFVGGTHIKYFLSLIPVGVVGLVGIILAKGVDYMVTRVQIWLDPWSDPSDKSWQIIQSMIAIGSGGVMGEGLGNSRQKYMYLPEAQNDFIFAIVCEELGLIGAVLIIALFVFLAYRGFVIANKAPNKFAGMLVIGITIQIALQALLNIAVVSNSIPNTGISLPFFSYGGTALVIQLAEMGIVLNVSRYAHEEKA